MSLSSGGISITSTECLHRVIYLAYQIINVNRKSLWDTWRSVNIIVYLESVEPTIPPKIDFKMPSPTRLAIKSFEWSPTSACPRVLSDKYGKHFSQCVAIDKLLISATGGVWDGRKLEDYGEIKGILEMRFFTCECLKSPVCICGCE